VDAVVYSPIHPHVRFGVEFELILVAGSAWNHGDIASALTQAGVPCKFLGYSKVTIAQWKIVTDSSIKARIGELPFELVSPILTGESGLEDVIKCMKVLEQCGVRANNSTGCHVHIDSKFLSLKELKNVVSNFCTFEGAFDAVLHEGRCGVNNEYAQSNRQAFRAMSNKQRYHAIMNACSRSSMSDLCNPQRDRYFKPNLQRLFTYNGTLEFRHSNGISDHQTAEAWIRLIIQFCETSRVNEPVSYSVINENCSVEDEIAGLLNFMKSNHGLVDFISRNIIVTSFPWKCTTCLRRFATSRQLMQHRENHPT